jgi:hypothetical protein
MPENSPKIDINIGKIAENLLLLYNLVENDGVFSEFSQISLSLPGDIAFLCVELLARCAICLVSYLMHCV